MKHIKHWLLIAVFSQLSCITVNAHDFEVNGIYYNIVSNTEMTVSVTFCGKYSSTYSDEYNGKVTIPEYVTYNSKTFYVTSIAGGAFRDCSGLTAVKIPNSVTSIGEYAFYGCADLTSVSIGNGVTSIGANAFYACSNLTSLIIPNGVASIGEYAFYKCSRLTSISIGNGVASIGHFAFYGCSGLTSVHISDVAAWCNITFGNGDNPLYYAKHLYMDGKEVKNLIIPDGVKTIGAYAFYGCSGLCSIKIPNSVTDINEFAFSGCSSLTTVTIPDCVEIVGEAAFYNCSSLVSITIGKKVTRIGSSAFTNCSKLEKVFYTNDIAAWCKIKFVSNTSNGLYYADYLYIDGKEIKGELVIPNTVASIGDYAFYGLYEIESITIPNTVTSIGEYAFHGTEWLGSQPKGLVYIGKVAYQYKGTMPSNTKVEIAEGTLGIAGSAFLACTNLQSVKIPNSVKNIGQRAFINCSSLTSITIPSSVESIGYKALDGTAWYDKKSEGLVYAGKVLYGYKGTMPAKMSIKIADGTLGVTDYAFSGCSGLTSISIPNSVTNIGDKVFADCTSLNSIVLYSNPTIGHEVFQNCRKLTDVYLYDNNLEAVFPEIVQKHLIINDNTHTNLYANITNTFVDVVYNRELPQGKYGTIMLPFAPDVESLGNFAFYTLTSAENDMLIFDEVEEPQANTPYLFSLREGKSATRITGGETTISSVITNSEEVNDWQMIGSFTNQTIATSEDTGNYYYAYTSADNQLHKVTKKLNVKPYRVYFMTDTASPIQLAVRTRNGGTTLVNVAAEVEDFAPAVYYDLSGRRVESPTKGLYIVNGKKLIL